MRGAFCDPRDLGGAVRRTGRADMHTRCGGGCGGLRHGLGVLMDADTGQVLYEKNGDKRMLIASTTKLMTALVALELGSRRRSSP